MVKKNGGYIFFYSTIESNDLIQGGFSVSKDFPKNSSFPLFFRSQAADLVIQWSPAPKSKDALAKANSVPFGTVFTDHMLTIQWDEAEGWQAPHIKPFGNLSVHPACSSLHYAIEVRVFRSSHKAEINI